MNPGEIPVITRETRPLSNDDRRILWRIRQWNSPTGQGSGRASRPARGWVGRVFYNLFGMEALR